MTDFRAAVQAVLPGVRRDLEDLIKIQSVSADPERFSEVQRSAEKVAELFTAEGFECQIVKQGGQPAVIGEKAGPAGARPCVSAVLRVDQRLGGVLEVPQVFAQVDGGSAALPGI